MPLIILDGPEAAGKSTIIDALMEAWDPYPSTLRSNGPKKSWLEYCQPLFNDLRDCAADPTLLNVWSRGWASRVVYNNLLQQGQTIPPEVTRELDNIVLRSGGLLFLVTSPEKVLLERRMERLAVGQYGDHQLNVHQELQAFQRYIRERKWITLSGTTEVESNVRKIIHLLVQRNPECRMERRGVMSMRS